MYVLVKLSFNAKIVMYSVLGKLFFNSKSREKRVTKLYRFELHLI